MSMTVWAAASSWSNRRLRDQRDDEHGLTRDQGSALDVVDQFHLVANRKRQGKGGGRGVRPVRDELDAFLIAVGSDLRDTCLLGEQIRLLGDTRGEVALVAGGALEIEGTDTVEQVNSVETLGTDGGQRSRRIRLPSGSGP